MRVCQIMGGSGQPGGLEKHVFEMCAQLAQQHEVIAITDPRFADRFGPQITHLPVDMTRNRYHPGLLLELAQIVRQHRPDVVHAQASKASASVSAIRRLIPSTCVATIHNIKRNTRMFTKFDAVIGVSDAVANNYGGPNRHVVWNGIAPLGVLPSEGRESIRTELALPPARPVVASVGRLVPVKRMDVVLKAMQQVDADLLIIGDGPERESLEHLTTKLAMDDRTRFLGHRSDVRQLLSEVDLTVIGSDHEGFPYVLVEALHARSVVVSTRVPGATEILPQEFLASCRDVPSLSAAISRVIANPTAARDQFEPVWDFAATTLTFDNMVRQTVAVYEQTLRAA